MSLSIPSFAYLERKHLAVEFNGTLAVDSPLLPSQHKRILWMAGDSEPRILPIHLAATQTDVQVCGDFPQRFGRNITNH
ncbi:hypothetical protein C5Y97_15765 [Blastopirellula marina]|uniref:Uncharacterized protein n=2 Tax=Blastopirellula marina TaxID=124 RepID=A0A2S8FNW9_9BACT|nr:hypothetical protein C5Y98_15755 [Blastopirellula marina]PTL43477.1 hypothetical protein C5Y97_15765 [Blastopirellula marina]